MQDSLQADAEFDARGVQTLGGLGTCLSQGAGSGCSAADEGEFDPVAYINTPRWQHVSLGLERISLLMEKLGNPQDSLKFVHVAGTNGKGSTCAYIASILQCAGYKTGLFTSPYIEKFEERIRVDGCNISACDLRAITLRVRSAAQEVEAQLSEHPTEFELMSAVAFCYFKQCECDIVVLEVGLGGRLDSTNVIKHPEVCVIARLGLDHTAILGSTIEEIAAEKAGIIKPGCCVVSYPQEQAAQDVVQAAAVAAGAQCAYPDFDALECGAISVETNQYKIYRNFSYKGVQYKTSLLGTYQPKNAALAIETVSELQKRGWNISGNAIEQGIENTRWPGRFEVFAPTQNSPWTVVDGGHNPQGIDALVDTLADVFPNKKPVIILSVLADKNHHEMISSLARVAKAFVAVEPPSVRALDAVSLANELQEVCKKQGREGVSITTAQNFSEAYCKAKDIAQKDGLVVFSGSLYSVALAKEAILANSI